MPQYALDLDPNTPGIRTRSMPLPISAVRVVYRAYTANRYAADGSIIPGGRAVRTVVDKLVRRPGQPKDDPSRYIANSDKYRDGGLKRVSNSVPDKTPAAKAQVKKAKSKFQDEEVDTLRFEVEEATWTPTLLRAPMPASVIDELRGKYSQFRTRHDPAYQAALDEKKKMQEAYKVWAKSGGGMLNSPAKEARMMEVERLKKQGVPSGLKTEVLEKIGEVMASKGIEMTKERRRDLERNLKGQEVLKPATTAATADTSETVIPQALDGNSEREEQQEI